MSVDVALFKREMYVGSVDVGYESENPYDDEDDEEMEGDDTDINYAEFDLGTCCVVTRGQERDRMASPEQSVAEGGSPMEIDLTQDEQEQPTSTTSVDDPWVPFTEQLDKMNVRIRSHFHQDEIKQFFWRKWNGRKRLQEGEDPEDADLALEKEFRVLTGHHQEVEETDIVGQLEEGAFNYDTPTTTDVFQSVLSEASGRTIGYDDLTYGPFDVFIRHQQNKDLGLAFIVDCMQQKERWPENDLDIKRTLRRLYNFIWIGREDDVNAGPMPVIADEKGEHSPDIERLQREGDPGQQKKMRARMHDRQTMFTELCRGYLNGDVFKKSVKETRGILEVNGKIVVPVGVDLHKKVIQAIHHSQGAFHLGVDKTKIILEKYFWFNSIKEKIAKYVKGCKQCQDGKRLTFRLKPELGQTSSYSRERLRTWAMDMIQMPKGHQGHNYILTCLDLATSWLEAWPVRRATADKVAEIISSEIVPRYGEGLSFIVDQGKEFTAHVVKEAVNKSLSKIHFGTVYNSQSNPVERFHRTLEGVMRCLLLDRRIPSTKWPTVLPDALRTMRSAPDATTKDSPYFRVFGMEPRIQAIEWMKIKPKRGGFSFNPDKPTRPVEVKGQNVYPPPADMTGAAKAAETKMEGSDKMTAVTASGGPTFVETIKQDDVHIEVTLNDHTRLLEKVPRTKEQEVANDHQRFYRQVFHLPLPKEILQQPEDPFVGCMIPQEAAQLEKDKAVQIQHERNAARQKKRFPQIGTWFPIIGELVDWKDPIDPDNPSTRKMRNPYQGPYAVTKRDVAGKTVTMKKIDPETMLVERRRKTVHVGQVRPTLALEFMNRPRGEDFDPSSLFNGEEADAYATSTLLPLVEGQRLD